MKCPICGAWTEVRDTRAGAHHSVRRRRQCGNGHTFPTMEVLTPAVSRKDLASAARAAALRAHNWRRDREIIADPRPTAVIARAWGLTGARVRQIRQEGRHA